MANEPFLCFVPFHASLFFVFPCWIVTLSGVEPMGGAEACFQTNLECMNLIGRFAPPRERRVFTWKWSELEGSDCSLITNGET